MAHALGIGVPVAGLISGIAAFALWVSAIAMRRLDAIVVVLFVTGLALALAGYFRGDDDRTRRLGVVAIGWNAFGLATLAIVYAAG
ncbi:MAG: hypothetical protein JWM53_5323 [bacterium]|nr:hypothetical protein [bacterium]